MNAQPQQTAPVANASSLGLNPYNRMVNMASAEAPMPDYDRPDRRSEGLNGATLDQLLRTRWQEGQRLGHQEGHNLAASRYSEVFDEGFVAGNDRGSAQMAAILVELIREPLGLVLAELEDIGKRSSSTEIKNSATRSRSTLEQLVTDLAEHLQG